VRVLGDGAVYPWINAVCPVCGDEVDIEQLGSNNGVPSRLRAALSPRSGAAERFRRAVASIVPPLALEAVCRAAKRGNPKKSGRTADLERVLAMISPFVPRTGLGDVLELYTDKMHRPALGDNEVREVLDRADVSPEVVASKVIVNLLSESPRGLSARSLSSRSGCSRSIVLKVLRLLELQGVVRQEGATKGRNARWVYE